jgi:hypothetical protein
MNQPPETPPASQCQPQDRMPFKSLQSIPQQLSALPGLDLTFLGVNDHPLGLDQL